MSQPDYIDLAADYAQVFATAEGTRVLEDIKAKGFLEAPASYPLPGKDGMTLMCESQRGEGRRELALYIKQMTEALLKSEAGENPAPEWTITGVNPQTQTDTTPQ